MLKLFQVIYLQDRLLYWSKFYGSAYFVGTKIDLQQLTCVSITKLYRVRRSYISNITYCLRYVHITAVYPDTTRYRRHIVTISKDAITKV